MILPAVNGSDFISPHLLDVVFTADRVSNGNTSCASIIIVDDTVLEGPHRFDMSIVGSDPPLMVNDAQASVTITDDEGILVSVCGTYICKLL